VTNSFRFQHRIVPAPVGKDASIRLCRASPTDHRLAYVREDGAEGETGIWIASASDALSAKLIVPMKPGRIEDLAFSPDGSRFAYRVAPLLGARGTVGWAYVDKPGESNRVDGSGFCWTPGGKAILVADPWKKTLFRYGMENEDPRKLGLLEDDADPSFPVRISVSPDGAYIAYTAGRHNEDVSEVWLIQREKDVLKGSILTEMPGASVHILPFWSPKGRTLGLYCVHEEQEKTAIIVVPQLDGEGLVLYESGLLDPVETPAFSPSAHYIAFFRRESPGDDQREGPSKLTFLDVRRETFTALSETDELAGTPRFYNENTLTIDGGAITHQLVFDDSP
jgi:hypothetical protein